MNELRLLSGGAAQGLVARLTPIFERDTGFGINGVFGAVGSVLEKLESGELVDLIILTSPLIESLAANGFIDKNSVRDIGYVPTAIARLETSDASAIIDAQDLRSALLSADSIYLPDPSKATAGIHFVDVLEKLSIMSKVQDNLRPYPNGALAMKAMASFGNQNSIGCTQLTEIILAEGVRPAGLLPPGYDLTTVYTAATVKGSSQVKMAEQLIALLCSKENRGLRKLSGFASDCFDTGNDGNGFTK